MTDELLPYYNRELAFIRDLGDEFAKANPKIAGRLRWSGGSSEDPHVSRMIEAFAFLNARTRHKLEDDFPEVCEALLGILYPHYLAPTPSASIVQCHIDRSQTDLTSGYRVRRGTMLETEPIQGQPCRFRTCYDMRLWPMELSDASYQGQPFQAPPTAVSREAKGVVRLSLRTYSPKTTFSQLELRDLRVFIHGRDQFVHDLYEVIHNHALGVALAGSVKDDKAVLIRDAVGTVGFQRDQGLIDYSPRSFLGYRLLSEYFSFPQKFMFFDLRGVTPEMLAQVGESDQLEVFIFVGRHVEDLERHVEADTFRIGCCPIVNLYRQRAEPIRWTHTETQHRVVPDARRPGAHEIYSVDRVVATSTANEEVELFPFHSVHHGRGTDKTRAYYHTHRQRVGGQVDHGTEVYLSLVDLDFQPAGLGDWTIDVDTTCVNRDLPGRLPFGGGQPALRFSGEASLARATCLTAPTRTFRRELKHGMLWQLISHLSLNHLSLAAGDEGADALREMLKLYDPTDAPENAAVVEGLLGVATRRVVGRVSGAAAAGFCRGLEVSLHLDEEKFRGSGVYLFASVLERFLALYSSINSFTKTTVTTTKRNVPLRRWQPRAGEKVLL